MIPQDVQKSAEELNRHINDMVGIGAFVGISADQFGPLLLVYVRGNPTKSSLKKIPNTFQGYRVQVKSLPKIIPAAPDA